MSSIYPKHGTDAALYRNAVESARADLALAGGFILHELEDGAFVTARRGMTRICADLAALREFIVKLGTGTEGRGMARIRSTCPSYGEQMTGAADKAPRTIEDERKSAGYVARLRAGQAEPGGPALNMAALRAFFRVFCKAPKRKAEVL